MPLLRLTVVMRRSLKGSPLFRPEGRPPEEEHTPLKSQERGDKKGDQRWEAGALRCREKARLVSEVCFPRGAVHRPA